MKSAIVIGGGVAGCTWAHLLGLKDWDVTLIERAPSLAGGLKTFHYGGHPYTFGPRHLFTEHEHVFDFLNARSSLRRLNHYLLTYVERDGLFYSYPLHEDDIPTMPDSSQIQTELSQRPDPSTAHNFEEYWIYSVGNTLYEKFVKNYSKKMWQIDSNVLLDDFRFDGKGVELRTGTKEVRPDFYIAYPYHMLGWEEYIRVCEATPGVKVLLNCNIEAYDVDKCSVKVEGSWIKSDILVSSISPDTLFQNEKGNLEYIGRDFLKLVLPVEHVIPDPTFFLHYANDEIFTRVVEYKKLTGYKSASTLLGIEVPSTNNKLYPYPIKEQQQLAAQYLENLPENVFSVGRMGNYRYYDIGMIVDEALTRTNNL